MAEAMLFQEVADHGFLILLLAAIHRIAGGLRGVLRHRRGHRARLLLSLLKTSRCSSRTGRRACHRGRACRGRRAFRGGRFGSRNLLIFRGGFVLFFEDGNVRPVAESTSKEILLNGVQGPLPFIVHGWLGRLQQFLRGQRLLWIRGLQQQLLGPVLLALLELCTQLPLPFGLGQDASIDASALPLGHQGFPHHSAGWDQLRILLLTSNRGNTWCLFLHGQVHPDGVHVGVADSEVTTCLEVRRPRSRLAHGAAGFHPSE
mmetsp:Transcript_3411/g.3991  ORF Transcript_3411/g.3991 Transcript_3411/m.3991 type:complete len:260 (-) Transcript_3411:43-822(-)